MDTLFQNLVDTIERQKALMDALATKLNQLEVGAGGGGGGSASIEDYASGQLYTRNLLVVDPDTETLYRVIAQSYTSVSVATDVSNGNLKVVGFEGQVIPLTAEPTQSQINALPDQATVVVYNPNDQPYTPSQNT